MAVIKDVAKYAKVSITTVSRYFHNNKSLKPKTSERIENAIEKLAYRRSPVAISLRTGRTNTIALIVPELKNPFYIDLYSALKTAASNFKLSMMIYSTERDREYLKMYLKDVSMNNVDGVILCFLDETDVIKEFLSTQMKIPMVLMSANKNIKLFDAVITDVEDGIYKATKHLIDLGHKKIAYVGGPKNSIISSFKFEGYKKAMDQANIIIDQDYIYDGEYNFLTGYNAMSQILALSTIPTAVATAADDLAIGCLNYLTKYKYNVPKQISLIGFNGIFLTNLFQPELSTVVQPFNRMAEDAIRLLVNQINTLNKEKEQIIFKASLKIGDSTAPLFHK